MKTLIENSIQIYGMGHPETKTVFNIKNESERQHMRFKSLTKISGRKLSVFFDYDENDQKKSNKLQLVITKSEDENVIKQFIVDEINKIL